MYLSKIDDLLDKIIDDFYSTISSNKSFGKIISEINFVKYQKEINDIFKSYISSLNTTELKELFKNIEVQNKIMDNIKRYIAVYLFLYIGYFYTNVDSTYINNIIEFSKNQPSYDYKIDNFFNSVSNALVIKFYQMLKQILNYLDGDTQKKDVLKSRHDYKESITFINELGNDFFKLAYYDVKEKDIKAHNIIKTIVITNIYRNEKKNIFKLLEVLDSSEGEFIFIDIVVPTRQIIDFRNIELLLSKKDIMKGLAYTLWDFITDYESELVKPIKSIEEKITELFESGIIMPIVDDYLLYHKDAENMINMKIKLNKRKILN